MTERVLGEIALASGRRAEAQTLLERSRETLAELGETAELGRTEALLERLRTGAVYRNTIPDALGSTSSGSGVIAPPIVIADSAPAASMVMANVLAGLSTTTRK